MNKKELRKEKRIKVRDLPESIRRFKILLNGDKEITVSLSDASYNGIGFTADAEIRNFIVGTKIILFPVGEDYAIYATIAHSSEREGGRTRVGVKILPTRALDKYHAIIKNVLSK